MEWIDRVLLHIPGKPLRHVPTLGLRSSRLQAPDGDVAAIIASSFHEMERAMTLTRALFPMWSLL